MATRTVPAAAADDNRPNLIELSAAVFHAAAKVASKEADRDELTAGRTYDVRRLTIAAEIDGQPFSAAYDVSLSVGHDTTRAGSAPTAGVLLAYLLGKMNAATRDATLRDLAEVFATHGHKLPVDETLAEAAEAALKQLRARHSTTTRGNVSAQYHAAQPAAAPARRGRKAAI